MSRDVLGLGCATIDELFFVDHYPAPDTKVPIQTSEVQGGGLTATALVAAARLGARCAYAGMLGPDATSQRVAQLLENEGVDTSLVSWNEAAGAIRSFIVVDTTNHTRNIFFDRPLQTGAAPDAPSEAEIAASKVLFIDHYGGVGNTRAVEIARRNGIPIVADFERTDVPNWDEFFPLVDHLVVSKTFASRLTNEDQLPAIARALWNANRRVVVITNGAEGGIAFDGNELYRYQSPQVEVVDTTGCGDVFHGVYAATLAWEFPLEKRLHWASVAAALKARSMGAQKGAPTRSQLEAAL